MKFINLRNWDAPQQCIGLIYFSQALEEMLFDFSLDTYKPSVMHTGLLCAEAINVVKEIEQGNIKEPNIHHVNAELCASFEKDAVAQSLVSLPPTAFFPILKNPKSTLKSIETVLSLLNFQLGNHFYKKRSEALLAEEVMGSQRLAEIRRLTRSYVTALVSEGFDQKFIHKTSTSFFYSKKHRIASPDAINNFFENFPVEDTQFNVLFRVDKIFEHLADALSPLGVEIARTPPDGCDINRYPKFNSGAEHQLFALVNKIDAKDIHSARNSAEYRLKLCATLLTIFHHKENPGWRPDCLVEDVKSGTYTQISSPINAMHKCSDLLQSVASTRLKALLQNFSLEKNSFSKFIRSTQLHSMALASNAYENQILNLWISLESLIPSETRASDSSNIEHIVDSLIPFLNIGYIERLTNNLAKDLLRWNATVIRRSLRGISGKKLADKLARLMVLPECAHQRVQLENDFRDFHLLRDRFEYLKGMLASPENITAALEAHKTRLGWQIRRIYRTRNIIVHSGRTPPYTKSLIEHTHDYLDTVLDLLVRLASHPRSITSVAQGFKL